MKQFEEYSIHLKNIFDRFLINEGVIKVSVSFKNKNITPTSELFGIYFIYKNGQIK